MFADEHPALLPLASNCVFLLVVDAFLRCFLAYSVILKCDPHIGFGHFYACPFRLILRKKRLLVEARRIWRYNLTKAPKHLYR